mgnify:CR=1 FL=1
MRTILIIVLLVAAMLFVRSNAKDSDSQRMKLWGSAIESINQRPWFGVGADGFINPFKRNYPDFYYREMAENAHNDILQVLVTCGVVGLSIYVAWNLSLFAGASGPFLGSLVAVFILAKVNPIQLESLVLLALIAGIYSNTGLVGVGIGGRVLIAFLGVFVASCGVQLAYADRLASSGHIQKACSANPYELGYKKLFLLKVAEVFNKSKCGNEKKALLDMAEVEVNSAKEHRPNSEVTKDILDFGRQIDALRKN